METDPTGRPLGYWLKHLHNLLEDGFAACLADLLAPFWPDARAGVHGLLHGPAGLLPRGWAEPADGDRVRLSRPGRELHDAVETRVAELRAAVLTGLTHDQYAGTVRALAVMAANLENRGAVSA